MAVRSITMIPYDEHSLRKDSIIQGESFSYDNRFLLISSRAIPKDKRIYAEFTIKVHPNNPFIRHIPIYLGIHKEPSFGVLAADCCLGSVYYSKNRYSTSEDNSYLSFDIMQRYQSQAYMTHQFVNEITARVPIIDTVIGIGVDMPNNTINLYSDGNLFYSFSPNMGFHINQQNNDIFLALYVAEVGEHIEGEINLGRFKTIYNPIGYLNLYQEYFDKQPLYKDIYGVIKTGDIFNNPPEYWYWPGKLDAENDVAPLTDNSREINLKLSNHASMVYYKDPPYNTIINKQAFSFESTAYTMEAHNYAYSIYPMAPRHKVYFEIICKEANLQDGYLGIPLTIGICSNPEDLEEKSYKIDLFHKLMDGYKVETVVNGEHYVGGNFNILNPSAPSQPNVIGIGIEKDTNTITIYTDGTEFCIMQCNKDLADFTKFEELTYFFIESRPEYFTGQGYCTFNPGNEKLTYDYLVEDTKKMMSLYYYYTYTIRFPYHYDFDGIVKAIAEFINYNRYIYGNVIVADPTEDNNGWAPGVNRAWRTYNKVSDEEEHYNVSDLSIFDIQELIDTGKIHIDPYWVLGYVNIPETIDTYIDGQIKIMYYEYRMQNLYPNIYETMVNIPSTFYDDIHYKKSLSNMFYGCKSLTTIPEINTENIINMRLIFYDCETITTIPQIDTSNVTDMYCMFSNCRSLTTIPQIDTSKVINMNSMFFYCKSLTTIPELDTSNVTDMFNMFSLCRSLPSVFPWTIDMSSITAIGSIRNMFYDSSVKEVTIKNLDSSLRNSAATTMKTDSGLTVHFI